MSKFTSRSAARVQHLQQQASNPAGAAINASAELFRSIDTACPGMTAAEAAVLDGRAEYGVGNSTLLLSRLAGVLAEFDDTGFAPFAERWNALHAWQGQHLVAHFIGNGFAHAAAGGGERHVDYHLHIAVGINGGDFTAVNQAQIHDIDGDFRVEAGVQRFDNLLDDRLDFLGG